MVTVMKKTAGGRYEAVFTLAAPVGKNVALAGSFNDWDPALTIMDYQHDTGIYSRRMELPPGTYEYKFVIDGEWVLDEKNPNFAANDFGTLNSVLTIQEA